jgi:hypothetical protein
VQLCVHHRKTTSSYPHPNCHPCTRLAVFYSINTTSSCSSFRKSPRCAWVQQTGRLIYANSITGAHRPYHRCFPRCHPLWISPLDSVSRILSQRAEAVSHSVSFANDFCPPTSSEKHRHLIRTKRSCMRGFLTRERLHGSRLEPRNTCSGGGYGWILGLG